MCLAAIGLVAIVQYRIFLAQGESSCQLLDGKAADARKHVGSGVGLAATVDDVNKSKADCVPKLKRDDTRVISPREGMTAHTWRQYVHGEAHVHVVDSGFNGHAEASVGTYNLLFNCFDNVPIDFQGHVICTPNKPDHIKDPARDCVVTIGFDGTLGLSKQSASVAVWMIPSRQSLNVAGTVFWVEVSGNGNSGNTAPLGLAVWEGVLGNSDSMKVGR